MEKPLASPASAERLPPEEISRLAALFATPSLLTELLDGVSSFYMILSRTRQAVFANRALREYVARERRASALGLRPGEAVDCIHACETPGGCGTTEFCVFCGAVSAIISGQQGQPAVEECRLIRTQDHEALDLRVFASPLTHAGEKFVILSAVDISDEKRRQNLERAFFHDIGNSASGVSMIVEALRGKVAGEAAALAESALRGSRRLLDEIRSQRDFASAERGKLAVKAEPFQVRDAVAEAVQLFREQKWAASRTILISPPPADSSIVGDRTVVSRVVSNMVKNALEASLPDEAVIVTTAAVGDDIEVRVRNPQVMPDDVQHQVFQRSFSTKGDGRGLGTYAMRLLTEHYLGGKVGFISAAGKGTTFWVRFPRAPKTRG